MPDAPCKSGSGLKVAEFSVSCAQLVRVARKGVSESKLTVDSSKLKGEAGELNVETLSVQR
jgi:hypothetical protein